MGSVDTYHSTAAGLRDIGNRFSILLLWLCVCAGCDVQTNSLLPTPAMVPVVPMLLKVAVQPAEYTARVDETEVCFGMFQPGRETSLRFSQSGMVQNVRVEPGQKVTEGQQLATLDQQPIVQQRQAAEDAYQRALVELNQASPEQRQQIATRINRLESQRNALDAELAKGQLRAPFAGVIARRNLQAGDFVSPQMTAFVLIDDGPPLVRVLLDAQTAAALQPEITLWIGHNGTARPAKIRQRSFLRGPVPGEQLLLELQEPPTVDEWSYAEVVEVRYRLSTPDSGYWLPLSAVHFSASGSWSVLVAEQRPLQNPPSTQVSTSPAETSSRIAVRRECQVLRYADGRVLVTATGLDQALVVIDGGHRLVPGQAVKPVLSPAAQEGVILQKDGP